MQEGLATREATIEDLQDKLAKKEAQQEKMRFEVACASTAEADVTHLMVRVATLEKSLAEVGYGGVGFGALETNQGRGGRGLGLWGRYRVGCLGDKGVREGEMKHPGESRELHI